MTSTPHIPMGNAPSKRSLTEERLSEIENAVRIDPARRGLLSSEETAHLGLGQLITAARHLAEQGCDIAIVTGFAIPTTGGPLPETDGPPGAALLADVCRQLGMRVRLITDEVGLDAVRVAGRTAGVPDADVECCPLDRAAGAAWCGDFLERTDALTHLIAIERPGPNHTLDSILSASGATVRDKFRQLVPPEHHDGCHNMRGQNIDPHTGPLHLLFETGANVRTDFSQSRLQTIGIGDGGNEIGMGSFAWELLHPVIPGEHGARIASRIATSSSIISGTSNWGGFALAAAVALLRDRRDLIEAWSTARHSELLQQLVEHSSAIDGVTRERTATVDGLPFTTYMQPWERIREIAGSP